jgi:X-X-X-Leu-X-X-Gly heptad repeat protein
MLIAVLAIYTLVTGKITDGSAELLDGAGQASAGAEQLKDGAGQLAAGAGMADTGAGKLSSGAEKVYLGVSEKLAPGADKLEAGADELAAGAVEIETDVHNKLAPVVYKVDDGALRGIDSHRGRKRREQPGGLGCCASGPASLSRRGGRKYAVASPRALAAYEVLGMEVSAVVDAGPSMVLWLSLWASVARRASTGTVDCCLWSTSVRFLCFPVLPAADAS